MVIFYLVCFHIKKVKFCANRFVKMFPIFSEILFWLLIIWH